MAEEPSILAEEALILPVCITVDASASMETNGSIDAVNQALPDLQELVNDDPLVGELARIGIVAFSDEFVELVPFTDLSEIDELPAVQASGGTSYVTALRGTRTFIETGVKALGEKRPQFYSPIVFFLTDGEPLDPEELWVAEADALRQGKYKAHIVCFGFGDANAETLKQIGTTFIARDQDPVRAVREIFRQLIGSIKTTSRSIGSGDGGPSMGFDSSITESFTHFPLEINRT